MSSFFSFAIQKQISEAPGDKRIYQMNAFQLIGMASSLDLSGLFEEEVCTTYFLSESQLPHSE
jgi:hypothetical protein